VLGQLRNRGELRALTGCTKDMQKCTKKYGPKHVRRRSDHGPLQDRKRTTESRPKAGPKCSRERQRRFLKSCFSGFIHFPRKRTLSGWALLFAMGKHTSKQFLYDREHVQVWKCRKTGTKVRSKSGQKWVSRVQSRWVQNDEMPIEWGSMVGEGTPKKG
jgi:hypothetical protein